MNKLEQHRKIWQGKSDEWLFERLANELTQKVEEIHKLLKEIELLKEQNETKMNKIEININLTKWHLIPFRHLDNSGFTWLCFQVLIY